MKKPVSATIEEELIKWLEREVGTGKRFRNRSHLIEYAVELLRKGGKEERK
jgi:Arc/MetJ-type ribon-helix-helix transcriptional regulator